MGGAIAAPTARTAAMLRRRSIDREGKRIAVSPVWVSMTTNGVGRNRHGEYGGREYRKNHRAPGRAAVFDVRRAPARMRKLVSKDVSSALDGHPVVAYITCQLCNPPMASMRRSRHSPIRRGAPFSPGSR